MKLIKYLNIFLILMVFMQIGSMERDLNLNKGESQDNYSNLVNSQVNRQNALVAMPDEIKLHILELPLKDIITNNSIFDPCNGTTKLIKNISLISSDFNRLRPELFNCIRKHFSREEYKLAQKDKNSQLKAILRNIIANNTNYSKELEIAAAKLIIAEANINLLIAYKRISNISPLMIIAISTKYINLIDLIIKNKADINAKDSNGKTALIWSIIKNNQNAVQKLLSYSDVDINTKNNSGDTALHIAISYDNSEIIEMLLNRSDIDINIKDQYGRTAFQIVLERKCSEIIALFKNVLQKQEKALARSQEPQYIDPDLVIHYGNALNIYDDVNIHCLLNMPYEIKLHILKQNLKYIIKNSDSILRALGDAFKFIVNIRLINKTFLVISDDLINLAHRYTSKYFSREYNDFMRDKQCFQSKGINKQSEDIALIRAIQLGHGDVVKQLINSEADVNVKDNHGQTALMGAVISENTSIARLLISAGADVNAKDSYGDTALILAIENENVNMVRLLLNANAAINEQNNNGKTALVLAIKNSKINIARLLVNAGADTNAKVI